MPIDLSNIDPELLKRLDYILYGSGISGGVITAGVFLKLAGHQIAEIILAIRGKPLSSSSSS